MSMFVCECVREYVCLCVSMCVCVCRTTTLHHTPTHTHTHTHTHILTHAHTHTHILTHTYTYTQTHIHTQAKEAAWSTPTRYEYTRIPKSYQYHVAAEEAKQKWQAEWITSCKAAATKQYFPSVRDRLGTKLTLTTKLAAVLTGHRKTRAYLYRFKLRDDARCICGQNDQTMDHLLFHCEKTSTQREVLKHHLSQQRNWMEIKQELISKHTKVFCE
jgi:hypothetical protein